MVRESEPRLLAEAAVWGVVGALAAQLFTWALRICEHFFLSWLADYHPPGLPEEGGVLRQVIGPHGLWLIPVATTLGGLISGLLVYNIAPEAEGHGTDTVVKAYHRTGGFIRARVAPLKLVASAITISSGGSTDWEGPTALIGAGVASILAPSRIALTNSGEFSYRRALEVASQQFSVPRPGHLHCHRNALRKYGIRDLSTS